MKTPKGRIERAGCVNFGDASISIVEEGLANARAGGGFDAAKLWESQFKRDVFTRIVQTLNRIGWACTMPEISPHDVKHYGGNVARWSAERKRLCTKGDLKADLEISGRSISLKMFQNVNAPDRPDHDGRYQSDLEGHMPYLLRLEMERTRRRIRDYLINVFAGYTLGTTSSSFYCKPLSRTAMESIQDHYAKSCHFKGDMAKYKIADCNRGSGDGTMLDHGQRVYFFDWHGRLCAGTALYNINNMWWVATGKYDYTNKASFELFARCPENPRLKRNADRRRKRIEKELQKAIAAMNFERAAVLRDVLFPDSPELFNVWHGEHNLYHCSGFSGYTSDRAKAGKFTANEVRGWDSAPNKVVPITNEKAAA